MIRLSCLWEMLRQGGSKQIRDKYSTDVVLISIWIRMMDGSWIWDFDVLPFYLAIREEFLR